MWDKDRLKFVGLEFNRLEIDKDTTEKSQPTDSILKTVMYSKYRNQVYGSK